jgi:putative OPT family oligopeptide transporter
MVIGGVSSIIRMRSGIARAIKSLRRHDESKAITETPRTERDIPIWVLALFSVITVIAIFFLYRSVTGTFVTSIVSTVAMALAGFFFVAVASYIVGLVGSSNSPVSGMTICTLLFASGLLLLFGVTGDSGVLAVLIVAGVVCCAASTAGDISQDLKTGHIVGSTPWKQQAVQLFSVVAFAFMIGPVLTLLHTGYKDTGGIGGTSLPAPQARLFEGISRALFTASGKKMPWDMVAIGVAIGLTLLIADELLKRKEAKFRLYVMPTAVGIYLPISLSVPILIGGLLSLVLNASAKRRGEQNLHDSIQRGVIFCSGLIAGEALVGILVAGVKSFAKDPEKYPIALFAREYAGFATTFAALIGIIVTLVVISFVSLKGKRA